MRVLVTGAGGPRGRQVSSHLLALGHDVTGVDTESWPNSPDSLRFERLDHRKRGFEELMRHGDFEGIVHLAVHAGFRLPRAERHRLNMEGTGKIIELAAEYQVSKLVVASHASVYGALADNPYFMTEQAPPRVGRGFPEMQDLATADLMIGAAMWQHPEIEMVVLRPVHSLGPTSRGAMATLLRRGRFPTILGFDPMVQVIHEQDLADAMACALFSGIRGVFNITGPGEVPLSVLIREAGCRAIPMPESLFFFVRGRLGMPHVPAGALAFIKHPCLINGSRFRDETAWEPKHSLSETLHSLR